MTRFFLARQYGLTAGLAIHRKARLLGRVAALACLLLSPIGWAQTPTSPERIDSLRSEIAGDASLTEDQRLNLNEELRSIAQNSQAAEKNRQALSELEDKLRNSDQLISDYNHRIAQIQNAPATIARRLGPKPALSVLESEAQIVESQRAAWTAERAEALDAMANLAKTEVSARARVAEISKMLSDSAPDAASPESSVSDKISALATRVRQQQLQSELKLLESQLRSASTLNSIRSSRIAWLDAAIAEAEALLSELRDAASLQRQSAAAQRASDARRILSELADTKPELKTLAEKNLALVSDFERLSAQIDETRQSLENNQKLAQEIRQDAQLTERRLEVAGLESQLGEVMLTRLASLPDARRILARNSERNELIADVSISVIDTEQELRDLGDRTGFLSRNFADFESWPLETQRSAERLYLQRRDLLQENMQTGNSLLGLLVDTNQAAGELAVITREYETLLTANLLWVRNYAYVNPKPLIGQLQALAGLRPATHFMQNWNRLLTDPVFLVLFAVALSYLRRSQIVASLEDTLGKPIRPTDESATLIFRTLTLSLFAAILPASIFLSVGRAAKITAGGDPLMAGLGDAVTAVGLLLIGLGTLNRLAGRTGAGRRLLKWNTSRADAATRDIYWFRPAIAISVATMILGIATSPTDSGGALGAIGSLAAALSLFVVALRMLRSKVFNRDRVVRFCLRASVLIAAAIIVMHLSGQLFAAHLYLRALGGSVVAVIGTLLVSNVLQRLLLLFRDSLERKAREEQRAQEKETVEESDEAAKPQSNKLGDVSSLSEAYSRMLDLFRLLALAALLWLIWSPALPALSIFDSITLWSVTDDTSPPGELRNITLSVVLLALVIIGITSLITRHLPPLINVALAEWTKVTPGSRYAAGMLMQYVIIGAGFSTALVMLGFQWEKVQWLVAALGVGIGFGLQEIVANFISGLIVLFERPIRVGDIINAGGADGTVTRINARATVIETFDGKELMIPNKELITGVVTNWSLSSPKLRLVIPIGVAYGSDVDAAMAILREIAIGHPEIMNEPVPYVSFEDFGDNALVLWLRCFALKDYPRVSTELRQKIYREFNAAGISIAFPQRDVHLDASQPLPIRIMPPEAGV